MKQMLLGRIQKKQMLLGRIQKKYPWITEVVDAKKPLYVRVTPTHIKNAIPKSPTECAIALAGKEEYNPDHIEVGRSRVILLYGHKAVRYVLLTKEKTEVAVIDRDGKFNPGIYQLGVPMGMDKIGRSHPGGKNTGKGKKVKGRTIIIGKNKIVLHKQDRAVMNIRPNL